MKLTKITKIRHTKVKNLVNVARDYLAKDDVFEEPKGFITIDVVPKKEAIGDELFIALINFANTVSRLKRAKLHHIHHRLDSNDFVFEDYRKFFEAWASYVLYWNDKAFNDGFPESVGSKLLWAWKENPSAFSSEISPKTRQIFFPESQ